MPRDTPCSSACLSKACSSPEGEEDTQAACNDRAAIDFSGQSNSQDPKLTAKQPKVPLGQTALEDRDR